MRMIVGWIQMNSFIISIKTGIEKSPNSLPFQFFSWFQNVLVYVVQAQRSSLRTLNSSIIHGKPSCKHRGALLREKTKWRPFVTSGWIQQLSTYWHSRWRAIYFKLLLQRSEMIFFTEMNVWCLCSFFGNRKTVHFIDLLIVWNEVRRHKQGLSQKLRQPLLHGCNQCYGLIVNFGVAKSNL